MYVVYLWHISNDLYIYIQVESLQKVDVYLKSIVLLFNVTTGVKLVIVQPQQGNFISYAIWMYFIMVILVLVIIGIRQNETTSVSVGENVVTANPDSFPGWIMLYTSTLRLLALCELRTLCVAGGVQVYSVTNYSTCCFMLHLQLTKNCIKEQNLDSTFHPNYISSGQTDNNCDL